VKLEGNSLFSSGDISGAVSKYTEALELCPVKSKKEKTVLYGNRAQCFLLLQQPMAAVNDATRALSLCSRHGKSLWRRAQTYDMLRMAKESLLDAILFINECTKSSDINHSLRQNKVPDYAEKLVRRQMRVAWLFSEAAAKHGGICLSGVVGDSGGDVGEESEWETTSDSDIGVNEKNADNEDEDDDDDDEGARWHSENGYGKDAYHEQ
jgi:hypothetical protein